MTISMPFASIFYVKPCRPAIKLYCAAIALFFGAAFSQAQTLRGTVRDADNGEAVTGATVSIRFSRGQAASNTLATTPNGEFVFEKIRAGYYSLEIVAQGYENQTLAEVYVMAGKEQVIEIALHRSTAQLAEVTILATQPGRRSPLPLGEIPLTRDQTARFPAMFFDPARLATAYAGVTQVDDGTNIISIRGNSPSSVRWRLEGVDIVNPNHLPNAGTFSDRPAAASGGILMFSAQLLDNSSLLTGAMPAGYGDALGGVMDMNLRKGNNRQHEFTAQAGLVGLDMAAEGPLGNGNAAYLVNYRYSTVGLLGQLGVSFGDEQINFQDLSFHLHAQGKNGSKWSLFGLGGLSENLFSRKTDSTEIKAYKDYFDIDYSSKTGVVGLSNWSPVGKNAWLKTSIAYSGQNNLRTAQTLQYLDRNSDEDINQSKFSASIVYGQKIRQRARWQLGFMGSHDQYKLDNMGSNGISKLFRQSYYLLQPWTQLSWHSRNQKNLTTVGLHSMIINGVFFNYTLEPRFSFTRKLSEKHRISLAAGVHAQTPSPWFIDYLDELIRSQKVELAYAWNFAPAWQLKAAVYRQWIANAPYFVDDNFSILNNSEIFMSNQISSSFTGRGNNQGMEWTLERTLENGWFLLANASFFDSKFTKTSSPSAKDWLPSRWDLGHLSNVTVGKEWQREKTPGKERTIGLNVRGVWAGSAREADIDFVASKASNTTVFNEFLGYYHSYPDYFRLDLRVYWRKNLGNRRNSTFALDLQNLTGQQNLAYHYFDPYTQKIETKFQLGTIPNFSWRVEF